MTRPPMGAKGFTLVELLVSMALLSMVMVGMLSVMRSMAQAQDRVEHRLDDSDDLRVATAFICSCSNAGAKSSSSAGHKPTSGPSATRRQFDTAACISARTA